MMQKMGCMDCHAADWVIQPADDRLGLPGDRRFFNLDVAYQPGSKRLEGRLNLLTGRTSGAAGTALFLPRREGFVVHDLFSDLRYHDVGEGFYEYSYEGGELYYIGRFRTPALWGVGSTAPYGHDGKSLTLDDVIRRHGGEAERASLAYRKAAARERAALISFLRSLVLYQPDVLPADLNGDGRIADAYNADGHEGGPERFQPELLFRVAPQYRGWTLSPDGDRYFSYDLLNASAAFGETLSALVDSNHDGVPDILGDDLRGAGVEPRCQAEVGRSSAGSERRSSTPGVVAPSGPRTNYQEN